MQSKTKHHDQSTNAALSTKAVISSELLPKSERRLVRKPAWDISAAMAYGSLHSKQLIWSGKENELKHMAGEGKNMCRLPACVRLGACRLVVVWRQEICLERPRA